MTLHNGVVYTNCAVILNNTSYSINRILFIHLFIFSRIFYICIFFRNNLTERREEIGTIAPYEQ